MMVNCPRCGFGQEKDQYCAQCGVDMTTYQPKPKPLLVRLLNSSAVQLFLLVFVVITVFLLARQIHRKELAERIHELASTDARKVITRRTADEDKKLGVNNLSADDQANLSNPEQAAPTANQNGPQGSSVPQTPQATSDAAAESERGEDVKGAKGASSATSVRVIFASIGRAALADLITNSDSRSLSTQGPIISGITAGFATRLRSTQNAEGWSQLDQSTRSIKLNQVSEFYGGQREETTGQFFGYVMEITPTQMDENGDCHLQIRAWRYLHDNGAQPEEFSLPLPESVVIPHGGGSFIVGSLPKRPLSEAERHFYEPLKVMSLLASEDYRTGNNDLIILIEPK